MATPEEKTKYRISKARTYMDKALQLLENLDLSGEREIQTERQKEITSGLNVCLILVELMEEDYREL